MRASLFEVGEDSKTARCVIDVYDLAKHTVELFDRHLVPIWVEQNQILRHQDTHDVRSLTLENRDSTEALRVNLLRHLTIYDRIELKHEALVDVDHDFVDLARAQVQCGTKDAPFLVLNHLQVLLQLKKLFHFGLGHDYANLLSEHFVENGSDGVRKDERYGDRDVE